MSYTIERPHPGLQRCRYAERMVKTRIRLSVFRSRPAWQRLLLGGKITEIILAIVADDAEYEFLRHEQEQL